MDMNKKIAGLERIKVSQRDLWHNSSTIAPGCGIIHQLFHDFKQFDENRIPFIERFDV